MGNGGLQKNKLKLAEFLTGLAAEESHQPAHVFQVVGYHVHAKDEVFFPLVFEPSGDGQAKKARSGRDVRIAGVGFPVKSPFHQEIKIIPG